MSKRLVILSLICITLLSACNLPVNNQTEPDLVASQVANLLTQTPLIDSPENRSTPVISETINSSEAEVVQTATPTATSTVTPTATLTSTPSGIPTGNATWSDPLDNGSRFGLDESGYDDGNTRIIIESGAMKITSLGAVGWRGWRLTSQTPNNYYMKVIYQTGNCSGSDQYGIIIQAPDYDSGYGYYFGLTCDGRYSIQKWDAGGLSTLEGWNQSPAILSGGNKTNTISILKQGNKYEYFINETSVANVEDSTFSNPGHFGPFISGLNTAEFSVRLEEISYWNLP